MSKVPKIGAGRCNPSRAKLRFEKSGELIIFFKECRLTAVAEGVSVNPLLESFNNAVAQAAAGWDAEAESPQAVVWPLTRQCARSKEQLTRAKSVQ